MKKNRWKKFKGSPIWIIVTVAVAVASCTYYVMSNLIVEHYKLEIARLEKVIDQRKQIEGLDSITNSLRDILDAQTKIAKTKNSGSSSAQINTQNSDKKIINRIDNLVDVASSLLNSDASDSKTFDTYISWCNDCSSLLIQIDTELKTNFNNNFTTLTRLDRADYPQLHTKVKDGLAVVKTIKMYY